MKTKTHYVPIVRSRADFPNVSSKIAVAKYTSLDIGAPFKTTLTVIAVIVPLLVALTAFSLNIFVGGFVALMMLAGGVLAQIAIHDHIKADVPRSLGRRLDDEVAKLVGTYEKLLEVRRLLPEGTGYHQRIEEFGRLAYQLLAEAERLPRMGGENKVFHRVLGEIRNRMSDLVSAGEDLADLIATQRAENTLDSIRFIGIDEYTDHISLEMATYRALPSGLTEEVDTKPIPPRPRKKKKIIADVDKEALYKDIMDDLNRL